MSETMTLGEINRQYPGEWVLLQDPETDEVLHLKSGRLLWHSMSRDELYAKARELRPGSAAVIYTGSLPERAAILL